METEHEIDEDTMSLDDDYSEASTEILSCAFCCEDIGGNPYRPCKPCGCFCCQNCIRKMFLNACKSESDMPPRCCKPIPLAVARSALSANEVYLFKEKHDEWSTANRSYCPIPTCSAFLPRRVFLAARSEYLSRTPDSLEMGIDDPITFSASDPSSPAFPIRCPKCAVHICSNCKQLAHPGSFCTEASDISPELAELLQSWGIKRCPKCRTAIRRMYGCHHMQCRCGAQWCWYCTKPIELCEADMCQGGQEADFDGESEEEEDDEFSNHGDISFTIDQNSQASQMNHDETKREVGRVAIQSNHLIDLDAGSHWQHSLEYFGEEPNPSVVDPFGCEHDFEEVPGTREDNHLEYECEKCWRKIFSKDALDMLSNDENSFAQGMSTSAQLVATMNVSERQDALMHSCNICNIMLCRVCQQMERNKEI